MEARVIESEERGHGKTRGMKNGGGYFKGATTAGSSATGTPEMGTCLQHADKASLLTEDAVPSQTISKCPGTQKELKSAHKLIRVHCGSHHNS